MRVPELLLHLGPISVPAHFVFESLAYCVGFTLYRHERSVRGDVVSLPTRNSVIVAAILGAVIGSKVLAWLEDPMALLHGTASIWPGGKTIAGGLLGGTIAVEWVKSRLNVSTRTGDLFAIPICLGIAVGRIGCFLGGVNDHTYGSPSTVLWAVDFGDGIPRHPAQLYEVVFLLALAVMLIRVRALRLREGDLYRLFLFSYLLWRLGIDFLKPDPAFAGLGAIQWACAAGVIWYSRDIFRIVAARGGAYANG
jgi:phosphatidylglycerol:prolipoprotein diacylglycerol transferase